MFTFCFKAKDIFPKSKFNSFNKHHQTKQLQEATRSEFLTEYCWCKLEKNK